MTLPAVSWNTFGRLYINKDRKPCFFNNFDQIEYHELNERELGDMNTDF